jgi:hypothetical protein
VLERAKAPSDTEIDHNKSTKILKVVCQSGLVFIVLAYELCAEVGDGMKG